MNQTENDFKRITRACCEAMGVEYEKVFTRTRYTEYVLARQISSMIIRQQIRASLQSIGKFFYRDHCTVLHGIQKINNGLDVHDLFIMRCYNACMKEVRKSEEFNFDENFIHSMNHCPTFI